MRSWPISLQRRMMATGLRRIRDARVAQFLRRQGLTSWDYRPGPTIQRKFTRQIRVRDHMFVSFWRFEIMTQTLKPSAECRAFHGLPSDAPFSYVDYLASIHPDDREQHRRALEQAITETGRFDATYRIIMARWIRPPRPCPRQRESCAWLPSRDRRRVERGVGVRAADEPRVSTMAGPDAQTVEQVTRRADALAQATLRAWRKTRPSHQL